ncbi:MAG: glycosyltransferase family 4 protein [Pseudomonadota bacterium]
MKILYSHRTRSADGQYVHIRALTEALAARGHALTICGPEERDGAPKKLDAGAPGGGRGMLPKPAYELAEFGYSAVGYRRLRAAAVREAPDILYERYNLFYHAGVRLARTRGLPFILEVNAPLVAERMRHGGLALKKFAAWSEGAIWRAADAVLPVTEALARHVVAAGVDPEIITVIQNGVDEAFLSHISGDPIRTRFGLEGKTVLGFTGFVRDWHGVDRVLSFMAAAARPDLHLLLVGDGPALAGLENQAHALGLADRFTVTGVVQREDMPAFVSAFDVALQPAAVEYASPLKLFEYMACARAILAPDSDNIKEVLTGGEDCVLFNRLDDADFERALTALVADRALRDRLGAAARASLLRQRLTWAHNAERVETIAQTLLESRP